MGPTDHIEGSASSVTPLPRASRGRLYAGPVHLGRRAERYAGEKASATDKMVDRAATPTVRSKVSMLFHVPSEPWSKGKVRMSKAKGKVSKTGESKAKGKIHIRASTEHDRRIGVAVAWHVWHWLLAGGSSCWERLICKLTLWVSV
jgi:hypothetical protein